MSKGKTLRRITIDIIDNEPKRTMSTEEIENLSNFVMNELVIPEGLPDGIELEFNF